LLDLVCAISLAYCWVSILNPFPLRRTSWHCCLPFTPGICMLSSTAFSAGLSCWLLLSIHVDLLPRTPLVNSYRSRGCTAITRVAPGRFRLPWTLGNLSTGSVRPYCRSFVVVFLPVIPGSRSFLCGSGTPVLFCGSVKKIHSCGGAGINRTFVVVMSAPDVLDAQLS
jgi:hypothetical protein